MSGVMTRHGRLVPAIHVLMPPLDVDARHIGVRKHAELLNS